jgi:hypothetical protein
LIIFLSFAAIGFAQADDVNRGLTAGKNKDVEPCTYEPNRDFSDFAIIGPVIDGDKSRSKFEMFGPSKINSAFGDIRPALCFIPSEARERRRWRRFNHNLM